MKFTLTIFAVLSFNCYMFCQNKVEGVVTYFFNDYQGDKPDIGAKVIVIDSLNMGNYDYNAYEKFHYGSFYFNLAKQDDVLLSTYQNLLERTKNDPEKYNQNLKRFNDITLMKEGHIKEAKKYSVSTKEDIDSLDKNFAMTSVFPKESIIVAETTVDGTGKYSIDLKPGTYYVQITSNNRKGLSMSEVMGKVYVSKIKLKPNQSKDLSYNFTLN